MEKQRVYCCIDLKSFYASVECRERGLDPITTKLVVADPSRTDKTITLAVSPAMKALGVPGRGRVFQIPKHIDYIMAPPRMALYVEYSAKIYSIYLRFLSKDDIHVYSIDEVFMDLTDYLTLHGMTARQLCEVMVRTVFEETGVTATVGIGTNLYLAKIAMDITAKHLKVGAAGTGPVPIGELTEETYRETLWDHVPLTDFWRIGRRTAARLARYGVTTMRGIAQTDPEIWYREFGIDAELLIDHAWGQESTRMEDIKAYRSRSHSLTTGQLIGCNTDYEGGLLIAKELADELALELTQQQKATALLGLYVGYDPICGEEAGKGSLRLLAETSSAQILREKTAELFARIVEPGLPIHRIYLYFEQLSEAGFEQQTLFSDPEKEARDQKLQETMLKIRSRFGSNAVLKGMDLQKGAMTVERHGQIGGHKRGE